jgi:hypothetical protein
MFSIVVEEMIQGALTRHDTFEQYERRYEEHAGELTPEEELAFFLDDFRLDFPHIAPDILERPYQFAVENEWIVIRFSLGDLGHYEISHLHNPGFVAWNVQYERLDQTEGSESVFERLGAEQGLLTLIGINRRELL